MTSLSLSLSFALSVSLSLSLRLRVSCLFVRCLQGPKGIRTYELKQLRFPFVTFQDRFPGATTTFPRDQRKALRLSGNAGTTGLLLLLGPC